MSIWTHLKWNNRVVNLTTFCEYANTLLSTYIAVLIPSSLLSMTMPSFCVVKNPMISTMNAISTIVASILIFNLLAPFYPHSCDNVQDQYRVYVPVSLAS